MPFSITLPGYGPISLPELCMNLMVGYALYTVVKPPIWSALNTLAVIVPWICTYLNLLGKFILFVGYFSHMKKRELSGHKPNDGVFVLYTLEMWWYWFLEDMMWHKKLFLLLAISRAFFLTRVVGELTYFTVKRDYYLPIFDIWPINKLQVNDPRKPRAWISSP